MEKKTVEKVDEVSFLVFNKAVSSARKRVRPRIPGKPEEIKEKGKNYIAVDYKVEPKGNTIVTTIYYKEVK